MDLPRVKTPCIGVCSTGIGDSVCRGCKRFSHEVIQWNSFTEEQKRIIDRRLSEFLSKCVNNVLCVTDSKLLKWHLEVQQIRHNESHDENCWLFTLLKAGAGQISVTSDYGFYIRPEYLDLNLFAIRDKIDLDYYVLSEAHYERYISVLDLFNDSAQVKI